MENHSIIGASEQSLRERARAVESRLADNPSLTALWVHRSDIYNALQFEHGATDITAEQLYFGAWVEDTSAQYTRKAALNYSFLSARYTQEHLDAHAEYLAEQEPDD